MEGYVRVTERGSEPVIGIRVLGGYELEIEEVVDTGFTGQLTLTPDVIEYLSLVPAGNRDVAFADDHVVDVAAYDAEIAWHERVKAASMAIASSSWPASFEATDHAGRHGTFATPNSIPGVRANAFASSRYHRWWRRTSTEDLVDVQD